MTWTAWAAADGEAIRRAGRWRTVRDLDGGGPVFRTPAEVVSFASNDYLGLTQHPDVLAAAHAAIDRWGSGAGSARLVVGSRPVHSELEEALAGWKRCPRALLFPTGFAANLGVLTVIGGPDVTILSDELNHASIIDGCRLARARVEIYRHRDVDHVARLLAGTERARRRHRHRLLDGRRRGARRRARPHPRRPRRPPRAG
ncbi:MAG: aminotransferase class I/II-fold pyridoxal phosphate-dependent enzyme [Acidimicrobiales bacterium]